MSFNMIIIMVMISYPCNTMTKMACSMVELREMQTDFTNCSRMKIEEHQNLENKNACQLVRKVTRVCGELWQRCHTSREVRRMKDLHIEAMVRQYGTEGGLEDCVLVREYRYVQSYSGAVSQQKHFQAVSWCT